MVNYYCPKCQYIMINKNGVSKFSIIYHCSGCNKISALHNLRNNTWDLFWDKGEKTFMMTNKKSFEECIKIYKLMALW